MAEKNKKKSLNIEITIGGISSTELLFFTRHLALAIKSGLTMVDALIMLEDQASGRMKQVLGKILQSIQSGKTFFQSLEQFPKYFSVLYVNLVKTGELSGNLEQNLFYLAENLKKTRELHQKVKSAMIYPTFIFSAIVILGITVVTLVLPKILPLFKTLDVELPASTQALMAISDAFSNHGFLIIGGLVGTFICLGWLIRQKFMKPLLHKIILALPVVGKISRNVNLEMFTHTLGTLISSGITLDNGLKITADATANVVYRKAIENIILEVQKGNSLANTVEKYPKLFPKMVKHMIAMGERTGSLETTFLYISEFYENEVDTSIKNLSTVIEPLMLIVIGGMVGIIASAILGPIYKITGSLHS